MSKRASRWKLVAFYDPNDTSTYDYLTPLQRAPRFANDRNWPVADANRGAATSTTTA
ncbi:MAG: hypothetical protein JO033_06620 [Acidobacteriaceae bacterium]|nr:hypothetical protein [Acidobacteriaceae bacterium]